MGEGNPNRSRTRRGEKSSVVIPEKNEGFGNLTMKQIVAAKKRETADSKPKKQKNKVSQEIKELEALIPILEKIDHEEEASTPAPEISKTEKEATPDDSLELNDIKKKKITYLEEELERQKKLLEFEKSKNSSEKMIKTIENHIRLNEETLANLKNKEKIVSAPVEPEVVAPEIPIPTPEAAPIATEENKKVETLAELKRTLRETIENAKKELAEIQKELREIDARELERKAAEKAKGEEEKQKIAEELAKRTETFSTDFIKERIKTLLGTNKSIKEIKNVHAEGSGDEIKIFLNIVGKKGFISVDISANMTLQNEGVAIGVKNHKIDASNFQSTIEGTISPELGKVPTIVKSFIEKEKGKKVEKIWIEDGQLKVLFV